MPRWLRRETLAAGVRWCATWATIVTMPLWKLQTVGSERDEFLYRQAELADGGIRLLPGVPQAFRSLYGLVLDAVRGAWVRQITRIGANRCSSQTRTSPRFCSAASAAVSRASRACCGTTNRDVASIPPRDPREPRRGPLHRVVTLPCRPRTQPGARAPRVQRQEAGLPRAPHAPRALATTEHRVRGRARAAVRRRAPAVRHAAHARNRVVGIRPRRAAGPMRGSRGAARATLFGLA